MNIENSSKSQYLSEATRSLRERRKKALFEIRVISLFAVQSQCQKEGGHSSCPWHDGVVFEVTIHVVFCLMNRPLGESSGSGASVRNERRPECIEMKIAGVGNRQANAKSVLSGVVELCSYRPDSSSGRSNLSDTDFISNDPWDRFMPLPWIFEIRILNIQRNHPETFVVPLVNRL